MENQLITEDAIVNVFKNNEAQVHNKVDETAKLVVENIEKLEFYKGYAKGMNNLIAKLEDNTNLEHVISEVQSLTNRFNVLESRNVGLPVSLSEFPPVFPNTQENPRFLQGQIKGITDSVQTLRNVNIEKYIENFPTPPKKNLPSYPALTHEERKEHSDFIGVAQNNCPGANIENLSKLCTIAYDMRRYTVNNTNGTLSNERFNDLTDSQEKEIAKILKDLPGVTCTLDYEPRGTAIKLDFPQGQRNNFGGYSVPELSQRQLTPAKAPEIDTAFLNTKTKNMPSPKGI